MFKPDFFEILSYFGLEKIDGKVYLLLLRKGPLTIGKLSKMMGMNRGKGYRSVKRLKCLGVISHTISESANCSAISPDQALQKIIEKKNNEIKTMKESIHKITEDLEKIHVKRPTKKISRFSIIEGRNNIFSKIGCILTQAKNSRIYIMTTPADLEKMYYSAIPEKILISKKNKNEVLIITDVEANDNPSLISRINPTDFKFTDIPSDSRIIVAEGHDVLFSREFRSDEFSDKDSMVYSNSKEFVQNTFALCSNLWQVAKKETLST